MRSLTGPSIPTRNFNKRHSHQYLPWSSPQLARPARDAQVTSNRDLFLFLKSKSPSLTTLVTIPSYQKALGANLLHETIFSITECNLRLFLYTATALFHTPYKRKEGRRVVIDRPLFFNTWTRRKKTPHSRYLEYLHTRFVSHVTGWQLHPPPFSNLISITSHSRYYNFPNLRHRCRLLYSGERDDMAHHVSRCSVKREPFRAPGSSHSLGTCTKGPRGCSIAWPPIFVNL